jgi:hypothetical protein
VSILDETDPDRLISRLASPLSFDAARAFRHAAVEALSRVPCWGEGSIFRAVAPLQSVFFDPPSDVRSAWDIAGERLSGRSTRLLSASSIERDSARQQKARRSRFQVVR